MGIDPAALARMTALSVVLGVGLELFLELLRFVGGIFSPRLMDESLPAKNVAVVIWLTVRDIIFFCVSGAVFATFVYYANNGNIRFVAIAGTLIGFFGCYLTLGRLIRRASALMLRAFYKMLYILFYPLRLLARAVGGAARKLIGAVQKKNRLRYTCREIKKVSELKHSGMP
ncbi:MAG: spore cortex biosynthesis protein YabQ [Clostridia bacterium]|nr:spore cortex biosynthesis protein YabQ [Clostridia bacterium]